MDPGLPVQDDEVRKMITTKDLSFSYGSKEVLRDINLEIMKGEFVGIAGSTGSGKTTFAMCLNGLIPGFVGWKFRGEVLIDGKNTSKSRVFENAGKVGLVFQDPGSQIFAPTVKDEIEFGPKNVGIRGKELAERVDKVLDALRIGNLRDRETHSLSEGEKKKVCIASVLAMDPEILVLDEPTANLDYRGTKEIYRILGALSREGKTIIVIEHKTEWLAKHADRVLIMDRGEFVMSGSPITVFRKISELEEVGVEVPRLFLLKNRILREENLKEGGDV